MTDAVTAVRAAPNTAVPCEYCTYPSVRCPQHSKPLTDNAFSRCYECST